NSQSLFLPLSSLKVCDSSNSNLIPIVSIGRQKILLPSCFFLLPRYHLAINPDAVFPSRWASIRRKWHSAHTGLRWVKYYRKVLRKFFYKHLKLWAQTISIGQISNCPLPQVKWALLAVVAAVFFL